MRSEFIGLLGVIIMIVLLFARMRIGLVMALVGFGGLVLISGIDMAFDIIGTVPYKCLSSYTMSAIPMFLFMAIIISNTGIGTNMFNTANKWIGQFRGGLAMATVLACGGLAAVMGDSMAETVSMSKIAVPEMRKHNYSSQLSTGCVAAGGTLGILIPPSIGLILYGILTEQSIGLLFMAGIFPGILLTFLFMFTVWFITTVQADAGPPGPKTDLKEKIASLKDTWHVIVLFILIIGGIYSGIFTPTEAGGIGAFGAVVICTASRRMTWAVFVSSVLEATKVTAMIALLIIGAYILLKFLTLSRLPMILAEAISNTNLPSILVFAGIIILYIILGMFLDIFASITLTIPFVFPVVVSMGFDPIWFGVVIVLVMETGMITPPVGINVFVLSGATGVSTEEVFRGVMPFVVALILCIALLTAFPQIALFLPKNM